MSQVEKSENVQHEHSASSASASLDQSPAAKARRRNFSNVDPASPSDAPPGESRFIELLEHFLAPINKTLEQIQETHCASQEELGTFYGTCNSLKEENKQLKTKVADLERETTNLKQKMINLEMQSRRCNLRFCGLKENAAEDPETVVLDYLRENSIDLDSRAIERAHRLGKPQKETIRPIIVRFGNFKDRDAIWKALGHRLFLPALDKTHIREDYPDEMERNRTKLRTVASAALKVKDPITQESPKVRLVADRLVINSVTYTVQTLHQLPDSLKLENIYTPRNENKVAFFTSNSPLSNHHISPFMHLGEKYNCIEQFLMAEKARHCADQKSLTSIMKETNPVKQKQLGKSLENFDSDTWKQCAQEKLMPGLLSKFEQNENCKDTLLKTENTEIFEANPHDSFWGTGLSLHSKDIWSPQKHKGKNLMGKCLMAVRSKLR